MPTGINVKGLKAEREADKNAATRIRVFPIEVVKRQYSYTSQWYKGIFKFAIAWKRGF